MSSFSVEIKEILEIIPIEGADKIELVRVDGYHSVVQKGRYKVGNYALYIPEAAVVPQYLLEELDLVGKLAGSQKNRVKAIKLRGALSQGIVCQPERLCDIWSRNSWENTYASLHLNKDFAEELGIVKYEPPIPIQMQGKLENTTWVVRWPDIENIKKYPDMFEEGEPVAITEKIHGTNVGICYSLKENEVKVYSKGLGARQQALVEDDSNLYWRTVHAYSLQKKVIELCQAGNFTKIALFGEVFGVGVQDLNYDAHQPAFAAFDMWVMGYNEDDLLEEEWVDPFYFFLYCAEIGIPTVPLLGVYPYDYDEVTNMATGPECVSGKELHLREGVVCRPLFSRSNKHGRVIAKFVSPDYLTRKGGTEYE